MIVIIVIIVVIVIIVKIVIIVRIVIIVIIPIVVIIVLLGEKWNGSEHGLRRWIGQHKQQVRRHTRGWCCEASLPTVKQHPEHPYIYIYLLL